MTTTPTSAESAATDVLALAANVAALLFTERDRHRGRTIAPPRAQQLARAIVLLEELYHGTITALARVGKTVRIHGGVDEPLPGCAGTQADLVVATAFDIIARDVVLVLGVQADRIRGLGISQGRRQAASEATARLAAVASPLFDRLSKACAEILERHNVPNPPPVPSAPVVAH